MTQPLQQRMQEKLDGLLSENEVQELYETLEQDRQAAAEYQRLEHVDWLLTASPQVRAPQRLAATIMARLAQTVQVHARLQELPEEAKQAVLMSLSLVMIATMPMMLSACYLVLNTQRDPKLLTETSNRIVAMMVMMMDALAQTLKEIEHLVHDQPEYAAVAMALMPVAMLGILEYINTDMPTFLFE